MFYIQLNGYNSSLNIPLFIFIIINNSGTPAGPPSGALYSYRKDEETHEVIFS